MKPNNPDTISRNSVVPFILKNHDNKVFFVKFVKKDGELREMNCRLSVKRYVKGVGMKYDPKDYDLLCVYDMNKLDENFNEEWDKDTKGAYRMVNIKTLSYLKIGGKEYNVVD